jgi:hypothetical protein
MTLILLSGVSCCITLQPTVQTIVTRRVLFQVAMLRSPRQSNKARTFSLTGIAKAPSYCAWLSTRRAKSYR